MRNFLLLTSLILLISACSKNKQAETVSKDSTVDKFVVEYSFFVAGHTYGNPANYGYG